MRIFCLYFILFSVGAQAEELVPTIIEGTLNRIIVEAGSKSEREALVLESVDGEVTVIRLNGDNAFEINTELEKLLGRALICSGLLSNKILLNASCELI